MIKFTYDEAELFNSLFEGDKPLLHPKDDNIQTRIIDMLYSLLDTSNEDNELLSPIVLSLIVKIRNIDDLALSVALNNLPVTHLLPICG